MQQADLSTQLRLEELLLHLKRLPRDAPLHPSILQVRSSLGMNPCVVCYSGRGRQWQAHAGSVPSLPHSRASLSIAPALTLLVNAHGSRVHTT